MLPSGHSFHGDNSTLETRAPVETELAKKTCKKQYDNILVTMLATNSINVNVIFRCKHRVKIDLFHDSTREINKMYLKKRYL